MADSRPRRAFAQVSFHSVPVGTLLSGLAPTLCPPPADCCLWRRDAGDPGVVVERVRAVVNWHQRNHSREVVATRIGASGPPTVSTGSYGKVMAGIDLDSGTQVDVDQGERRVHIVLPPAKVLGVEVTQLRTYDERNGLWNPFRPADRDTIYYLAREQLVNAAGELGVTAHAEESARCCSGADSS